MYCILKAYYSTLLTPHPPVLDVPTYAAWWCLNVLRDARDPSSEKWNLTKLIVNFQKSAKRLIQFTFLHVIAFKCHVLTVACIKVAVFVDEVTVVVNCYDVGSTIPHCCKNDIRESCCLEEFIRIRMFELYYVRQGGTPYCLPELYQIQQYHTLNSISIR
jgi:hypothetical protein